MPERHRPVPRGLQRVLLGYLAAVLAVACGLPALVLGWILAARCTSPGFTCLGFLIYGMIAAGAIAVITFPLWSRRSALGWWFTSLGLALVIAPIVLGEGGAASGTAFLGPGLAAWISDPVEPDPETVDPLSPPADRPGATPNELAHWGPRFGAALVLSLIVPVLGRAL